MEYECKTKLNIPKAEYLAMTLKEFVALRECYLDERREPAEQEVWADDLF